MHPSRRALFVSTLIAGLAIGAASGPRQARACTTFRLAAKTGPIVGKCYDWSMEQGLVLWNKRGLAKSALPVLRTDRPAEWQSKYASLTFNQYGREMPNGGMNEAGLVVEIMWLSATRHPPADERRTVNELQWIQYQLDRFATVAEVVDNAPLLRVGRVHGDVHYLACDRSGDCAALEYLEGRLVITRGPELVAPALTNSPYAESAAALPKHQGFGGKAPIPEGAGSLERFVRAASRVRKSEGAADGVAAALGVLESVRNDASQWQIVYDPIGLVAHWKSRSRGPLKTIDLKRLIPDGSCRTPVRMIDLRSERSGDVTAHLSEYTDEADRRLIEQSFSDGGLREKLGAAVLTGLVRYPRSLACVAP
jgi:choloylglycine hydrolase